MQLYVGVTELLDLMASFQQFTETETSLKSLKCLVWFYLKPRNSGILSIPLTAGFGVHRQLLGLLICSDALARRRLEQLVG